MKLVMPNQEGLYMYGLGDDPKGVYVSGIYLSLSLTGVHYPLAYS